MAQLSQENAHAARPPARPEVEELPPRLDHVEHSPVAPSGPRGAVMNVVAPFLLVVIALGIGAVLISSPPNVPKSDPEALAPIVGLDELESHDAEVFVEAFGTVVPAREIRIIPEVTGRIIELNEKLEPGGLVSAGERLVRIEPADYEIAVSQATADLEFEQHEVSRIRARIDSLRGRGQQLDIEIAHLRWNASRLGRLAEEDSAAESEARDAMTSLESQKAARRTLDAEINEQQKAVESAIANVRIAERRLEVAKLALERTEVTVPFDAIVVSEDVELGQRVSPQTVIATLVATDEFWAEAAIPVERLQDLRFAVDGAIDPSRVTVSMATGRGAIVREGVALRPLGNLDPLGRMARVLVSIQDPLGLTEDDGGAAHRILLGSYVRLRIESGTLKNVYPIPRKALRENDRVWVRDAEGRLAIRPVDIVWRRHDDVLVRDGFEPGDRLVTTHLASVVPGMPLRTREEASRASKPGAGPVESTRGAAAGGTLEDHSAKPTP